MIYLMLVEEIKNKIILNLGKKENLKKKFNLIKP